MTTYRPLSNTAVLVLGMHRSGTSAVTGVLQRVGVELGSELFPPAPENPKGFFEHSKIVSLHEEVLALFDATWDAPSSLPEKWDRDPRVSPLRQRLKDILLQTFDTKIPLWGVKDPRLCRLLPLWMPVLRELDVSPKALLVVRNPLEVAASLRQRNGMMPEQALTLWLSHVLASELDTRELPRAVILYEDLLRDWASEVRRVSIILGIDLFAFSQSIRDDVAALLEPELRRHRNPVAPPLYAPHNMWANSIYHAIAGWRREEVSPTPLCDQAIEALAEGERAAEPFAAYFRVRLIAQGKAARAEAAQAIGRAAAEAETAVAEARTQTEPAVAQAESAVAQAETALAQAKTAVAEARARVETAVAEMEAMCAEKDAEIASLKARVAQADESLQSILRSTNWRLTAPLRYVGSRYPILARYGRRALKLV